MANQVPSENVRDNSDAESDVSSTELLCDNCKRLQEKLDELQEGTLVQSMNDMKEKYEDLCEMSVCVCVANFAQQAYYEMVDLLTTIHVSVDAIRSKLEQVQHLQDHHTSTPAIVNSQKSSLKHIDFVLKHIQEVIKRNDYVGRRMPFPEGRCISDCDEDM
jgi:hypothetical protein